MRNGLATTRFRVDDRFQNAGERDVNGLGVARDVGVVKEPTPTERFRDVPLDAETARVIRRDEPLRSRRTGFRSGERVKERAFRDRRGVFVRRFRLEVVFGNSDAASDFGDETARRKIRNGVIFNITSEARGRVAVPLRRRFGEEIGARAKFAEETAARSRLQLFAPKRRTSESGKRFGVIGAVLSGLFALRVVGEGAVQLRQKAEIRVGRFFGAVERGVEFGRGNRFRVVGGRFAFRERREFGGGGDRVVADGRVDSGEEPKERRFAD